MDGDDTVGTLSLRGRKVRWQTYLAKLRRVIAWPMIIVFALGSAMLWISAINNLIYVGGFAGIISWQILGFFLPIYQARKLHGRVSERDIIGRFITPKVIRKRLWAIIWIIWLNALANATAIMLVVTNWLGGRLDLSRWDIICFGYAAVAVIVLLLWKRRQLMKSQAAVFFLAAGTRMMPQMCLAFSLELRLIPWAALLGVAAIAGQRFIVSSIELAEAKSHTKTSPQSLSAARWVWRGDVGNLVAITVPVMAKLL